MVLRAMSDNNLYFLFEDRVKREFKVFTLGINRSKKLDEEEDEDKEDHDLNTPRSREKIVHNCLYQFRHYMDCNMHELIEW